MTEHHLASTDVKELTDWSHKRRYTLLELYRGQTMIYSSFAPKDGMISFLPQNGTSDQNPGVLVDKTDFYDWLPCYTLTFADGEVSAMLYYNGFNTYYGIGCEILLSLCILWWFPSLFLLHCRRILAAVEALRMPRRELSLDDIACQLGYSSLHYFYCVFKNYTGLTPAKARELIRLLQ